MDAPRHTFPPLFLIKNHQQKVLRKTELSVRTKKRMQIKKNKSIVRLHLSMLSDFVSLLGVGLELG